MKLLRFLIRSVFVWAWVATGLITELLVFPLVSRKSRRKIVQYWSRGLMLFAGVRIKVIGEPVLAEAIFWVANHISWVDIFVLNSVRTTSFLAKSDVRKWPVIGHLVAWAGTLFIDRRQRYAIREAAKQIQNCFKHGDVVGLFPEGTTTDGSQVKNFHTGLFDAPIQSKVPVQPVALRYLKSGVLAPELAFVGEQTLVANLWHLLGSKNVTVECSFLPIIKIGDDTNRSTLAAAAHKAISGVISGTDDNRVE